MVALFFALVLGVICAGLSGHIARAKGYDSVNWSLAGLLFGPLTLFALAAMPDLKLRTYLRAIAENAGVGADALDASMLDGLPERQLTSASFDFKTNTECAKKHKLDQLILAIQKDIPEFASHVSPATSKVYPSRVVANNAAGELIAEAYGVNKLGTTYWTIKYPAL